MNREQTATEERWNVITHLFGLLVTLLAGGAMLLLFKVDDPNAELAIGIYLFALIFMYAASTSYHRARSPDGKNRFRILDHISIYLLIAGTYTPVCLLSLPEESGMWLLYTEWSIVLAGSIFKIFFIGRFELLSASLYVIMGWLVVIEGAVVIDSLSPYEFTMLVTGGVLYTVGVVFYAVEKLYFHHVVWHVFVLLASAAHFAMIWSIVM